MNRALAVARAERFVPSVDLERDRGRAMSRRQTVPPSGTTDRAQHPPVPAGATVPDVVAARILRHAVVRPQDRGVRGIHLAGHAAGRRRHDDFIGNAQAFNADGSRAGAVLEVNRSNAVERPLGIAYDEAIGKTVLFGGLLGGKLLRDTYVLEAK